MKTSYLKLILALSAFVSIVGCGGTPAEESTKTFLGGKDICIVSQYTPNQRSFAEIAVKNHEDYAKKHDYTYRYHSRRISGETFRDKNRGDVNDLFGGGLYWQKVAATKELLGEKRESGAQLCSWVMWVDSDIVFSNFNRTIEGVLEDWAEASGVQRSLLLPRDESGAAKDGIFINNGAFLLRNNAWARDFIGTIEGSYFNYRNCGLPDQDAFQDFVFQTMKQSPESGRGNWQESRVPSEVVLVPQRIFDSFHRPTYPDPAPAKWVKCDYVAHISATSTEIRVREMKAIVKELDDCR